MKPQDKPRTVAQQMSVRQFRRTKPSTLIRLQKKYEKFIITEGPMDSIQLSELDRCLPFFDAIAELRSLQDHE